MPVPQFSPLRAALYCLWLLMAAGVRADEPQQSQAEHKYTNALIHSNSPYLLQHAHNPVHWLPWGPEAFAKAKAQHKPIFVSIGYSTCYWCHVMERESFENEEVAAILNAHYIAIKVDREQRPDIDEQLMLATQLMTGRGGWPNSVWLTTDGRPWMAGTYFPREQFMQALQQLSRVWTNEAAAVEKQAQALSQAVRERSQATATPADTELDSQPLEKALSELQQLFDARHGGFGTKPKFPPHGALRLLSYAAENGNEPARHMLTRTLDAMWRGGIHDHIGGGFHRYSTDERWFLPHFEKMLYDNAQLMRAYAEGFQITHDEDYRRAAYDIFAWLQREMTHPQGAFYSAIDSESSLDAGGEREEGRFTTWSVDELRAVLPADEAQLFSQLYNFSDSGNFTEEATGRRPGTNIPYRSDLVDGEKDVDHPAAVDADTEQKLARIRAKLLEARDDRDHPHLDDKILTSWNGLMIASLAYAGRVFEEPAFTTAARRAADFLLKELRTSDGLLHSWRDGKASISGYLDDYAFLIEALLELHTTTGEDRGLTDAKALSDEMLLRFEDKANGGFYFTSNAHEVLLVRSKNLLGGGNLPIGNGVATENLLALYEKTRNEAYLLSAERGLKAFSGVMLQSPRQVEQLVLANAHYLDIQTQPAPQSSPPQADDKHQGEAVTASLYVSHAQRAANQPLDIAVGIRVHPSFHLYGRSEEAGAENLVQATTVRLLPQPAVRAGKWQLPVGKSEFDDVLDARVTTYTDLIWFHVRAQIAPELADQEINLQIELKYQACDSTRCLQPQTVVLEAPLIISAETVSPPKHARVFERW